LALIGVLATSSVGAMSNTRRTTHVTFNKAAQPAKPMASETAPSF
jgi:hypothetical protein